MTESNYDGVWACDGVCGFTYTGTFKRCLYRTHDDSWADMEDDTILDGGAVYCHKCWPTVPACGNDHIEDCEDCIEKAKSDVYKAWWAIVEPHWPRVDGDSSCEWFEPSVKPTKVIKPVKSVKPVKASKPLPVVSEGIPTAADYRVKPEDIDESVCVGRLISGGEDKRWSPTIYKERQCGKKTAGGDDDLCKVCRGRSDKYADNPRFQGWTGRVTEDPLDWVHMLDTVWGEAKQPKFNI